MYDSVVFDFDNTLSDFDRSEQEAVRRFLYADGITDQQQLDDLVIGFTRINPQFWDKRHELGITAVFQKTFETLYRQESVSHICKSRAGEQYLDIFSQTACLEPGCQTVIEHLSHHFPLFVISNGLESIQAKRVASTPIAQYFRDVIVSGDVGVAKPDRAIFDKLINKHGLSRGRVIYIGDSLRDDYTGSQNSNIDFCFYNRKSINTSEYSFQHEVQRLNQIPVLFGLD